MTAQSSELLAIELERLGLDELALRARQDEFHDFLSPHAMPETMLIGILADRVTEASGLPSMAHKIFELRQRVINGDFDASLAESDEWWKREGQYLIGGMHGKDPGLH